MHTKANQIIGRHAGRIWGHSEMLKFNAQGFYRVTRLLADYERIIEFHADDKNEVESAIDEKNTGHLLATAKEIYEQLEILSAQMSLMTAKRLMGRLEDDERPLTYGELGKICNKLGERIEDELSLLSFFVLAPDKQKYFEPGSASIGQKLADRLPGALPDLEDAGKCIALNQGTASVFHSMRAMEVALKALGNLLGIPYAPSWESYIRQIEAQISAKHKTKSTKWKRHESFYREILGNLQSIKIAWRNPTMHVVRRYSVNEAEEIFVAVRNFMVRLSDKLPAPKVAKATKASAKSAKSTGV